MGTVRWPGLWAPNTHSGCVCNEYTGIVNRVLGATPEATDAGKARFAAENKRIFSRLVYQGVTTPKSLPDTVASFAASKRKRYQEAYEHLQEGHCTKRDAQVKAFVKPERWDFSAKEKAHDPRIIQFRSYKYNLELASYLRGVEHRVYGLKTQRDQGMSTKTRLIFKGLNSFERAAEIRAKWDGFRRPVCVSIDASRWDKHVAEWMLEEEHRAYLAMCPSDRLRTLLRWQRKNRGVSTHGIRYWAKGKRMSGDMNTALGNCYLMVVLVRCVMGDLKISKYDIGDDGDDCLLFVEEEDLARLVAGAAGAFLEYGHEVKIENITREFEKIVHCQCRPTLTGEGWAMVRDWRKVLSHACSSYRHYNEPKGGSRVLRSVGHCEVALHPGVPILQEFGLELLRRTEGIRPAGLDVSDGEFYRTMFERGSAEKIFSHAAMPVTDVARVAFHDTWGVSPDEQLHIEAAIREMDLGLHAEYIGPEWLVWQGRLQWVGAE